MFESVLVKVAVFYAALLRPLLLPFLVMGAAAVLLAGFFYLRRIRAARQKDGADSGSEVRLANPFSLTSAVKFAAFFAAVLLVLALVQRYFPGQGLLVVAAIAGLTDVDAITLSMADYARGGNAGTAVSAIVIASLSNTVVKTGMVAALGGPDLRRLVLLSGVVIVAAGALVLLGPGALSTN